MAGDDFEWHAPKRAINLEKHGIDFEDAIAIWTGPVATRRAVREPVERFVFVGVTDKWVIAVVWTKRGSRRG